MMDEFTGGLNAQALKGLKITDRILDGEEIDATQARIACNMINGKLKSQANENGRMTRAIALTKMGIRDPEKRERIAIAALSELIPSLKL